MHAASKDVVPLKDIEINPPLRRRNNHLCV
jgi:hypothetical protein